MQFDVNRAFPYPVLRPGVDDYVDGDFQATIEFKSNEGEAHIHLEARFDLSVDEIRSAIDKGYASFVLVVSCRDTYFRKPITTQSDTLQVALPAESLRGQVEVLPYVVVNKLIKDFSCKWINKEFGSNTFRYEPNTLLALDEPKAIYLERDLFRPVTSVFEMIRNDNVNAGEWSLTLEGEKVQIALHSTTKAKVDVSRNTPRGKAILLNSIYFSAVMQCLSALRDGTDYDGYRWANVFRQQCHNRNIKIVSGEEYRVAQTLLKSPLGMLNSYVFEETAE